MGNEARTYSFNTLVHTDIWTLDTLIHKYTFTLTTNIFDSCKILDF